MIILGCFRDIMQPNSLAIICHHVPSLVPLAFLCSAGYQSRLVFCTIDNEAYPDYMCRDKPWPGNNRTCSLQPCPQTKRVSYLYLPGAWSRNRAWNLQTKSWKTGDWGQCSATCGGGIQSRSVYCATYTGHHFQDAVDDTECASLTEKPRSTQPCNLQQCATWVSGPWSECSKSCASGIRTRQVICADGDSKFYSYEICQEMQPQIPTTLGSCNTQPCHLPQQVPSMQDITGFNISRRTLLTRYRPDQGTEVSRHERIIQSSSTHHQAQLNESPRSNFLPLGWDSYSDSSLSRRSHSYPNGGSNVQDCNHTPHGCCSDGHTAATGPFGQGCPLDSCHLSRYGCCPDGISRSQGPNQEGCTQYYSDVYISRNHPITPTPTTSQVLAQQVPTEECRGSMYGCCYDNIASALGPQGEGCPTRLSQSYPVQCLLPSAHGSCTDWTIRWYFVSDVGKCNRFWYGSCHGNKNNFATEEECMKTCHGSMGRSYVSLHPHVASPNIHSSSQLQEGNTEVKPQQFGRTITHRTGNEGHGDRISSNQDALPESEQGASLLENQPESSHHSRRLDEIKRDTVDHLHGLGETLISRHSEKQLTVNGQTTQHEHEEWRRESGADGLTWRRFEYQTQPDSTFPYSLNRIFLDGPESSAAEAGLGQSIRLLCKTDNSHFSRVEWQKDGQPISSDRHTYQSDNSLVVSHLRTEDAGIYMCIISNGRVERRQIELLVKGYFILCYSKQLKMYKDEPSVVDASIGEEVRLPCRVEASPSLTIEWQKDGHPISSARHRQQPDGALLISHLTAEDAGFFTCIASNGRDQDQKKVQIRPRGDLRIIDLLPRLSVSEGENAHLHCVVTGDNVNIRWSRNGVPVRSNGRRIHVSQDGSLFLNNVQLGDEGSYTCNAYSGNHSVSASTDVKVIKRQPEVPASLPMDTSRECADQPHLANCDLILQAQLCNNEYYSSFCCASCSRRYG
ncbi:Papilin, partial [Ophiophagus hannah]